MSRRGTAADRSRSRRTAPQRARGSARQAWTMRTHRSTISGEEPGDMVT